MTSTSEQQLMKEIVKGANCLLEEYGYKKTEIINDTISISLAQNINMTVKPFGLDVLKVLINYQIGTIEEEGISSYSLPVISVLEKMIFA